MHRSRAVQLVVLLLALLGAPPLGSSCVGLSPPASAPIVASYAPVGDYAGHWGIDFGTDVGTPVTAAADGVVTFAGVVAGNSTVSIDHGGGLKTSYSFLAERVVSRGVHVQRGARLGVSAEHDGRPSVHFSVRLAGAYVDPLAFIGCVATAPGDGLRLVPIP